MINTQYQKDTEQFIKARNEVLDKFISTYKDKVSKEDQIIIQHSHLLQLRTFFLNGRYTSEQIATSFLLQSAQIGRENNYIGDANPEETLRIAREADQLFQKIKDKPEELAKLPLLGLPLSIKESSPTKGFRTTLGFQVNVSRPVNDKDAYIIEVLRNKGAVPLITSNVPQALLAIESENRIYGRATNPFNKERTAGGSSGGEGGLIRTYCSAAGIGTDIGGSIRIPASFCGIYGFKPTAMRISRMGFLDIDSTQKRGGISNIINSTSGPMARSMSDITFLMKNILGEFPLDTYILNKKFSNKNYEAFQSKERVYKIGYIKESVWMKTSPNIVGVLDSVIETLKDESKTNGYKFVLQEFPFEKLKELYLQGIKLFSSLGNFERILAALKGEPTIDLYSNLLRLFNTPNYLRTFFTGLFCIFGKHREAALLGRTNGKITLNEFHEETRKFFVLKDEFYTLYQSQGIDALLTPVTAFLPPHHGDTKDLFAFLHFSMLHNFLDLPSGVIPIRKNGKNLKEYEDKYKDKYFHLMNKNMNQDAENLPIGIQIATLPHQDEACLAVMKVVNNILIQNNVIQRLLVSKEDEEYEKLEVDNLQ